MYCVGRVIRASGLKGEVRIQLFRPRRLTLAESSASPRAKGGILYLELGGAELTSHNVEHVRTVDPTGAVVRLSGVPDRDAAEALQGALVYFDPRRAPVELADEADQVLGAHAVDADTGAPLGVVETVQDNGAQPLLVLRERGELGTGEEAVEKLVPFVDAFIAGIDLPSDGPAVVRIRVIPGLFDLDGAG